MLKLHKLEMSSLLKRGKETLDKVKSTIRGSPKLQTRELIKTEKGRWDYIELSNMKEESSF